MMKEQIASALVNKDSALRDRDAGNLESALSLITEATNQLDKLWEHKGESINRAGANASPEERDLVEALAETYGVKGGILRSDGKPEEAVRAYDKGLTFEQHPARKVDNSYNLVQRLINRVLVAPHRVGATKWEVVSKDMWKELEKAGHELHRQITTSRVNDPWAAADMIMVQLLLDPQGSSKGKEQNDDALQKFESLKPKARVYASTLRALKDFEKSLEQVTEDNRLGSWKVVVDLLNTIVERLEEGFKKAKAR
jgi:tetratricopeptide (TPR) repeat protein